ncbi:dipeptide/oligopeptide/nickel ABC transporter ATP-binding protein [Halococcus morrhuae DSM 1307]|uniref:Dipeptide/oligopeptide/nickel ABC transporter ATP-binding protein n=1 Tax=Halococcus morrhuae DSM 1307 TaxID=931277 RepID=M0N0I6_HALMO|nr:ABC transporter ATP-binding protein [Halococcus morrhuae]EMA51391.1 dipeptide/oligopeptide/nickel ABC transporter ATP-binding protein [Halococcus morrhuae DSM 1307]
MSDDTLLSVHDLTKHYPITEGLLAREVGRVRAVDGISFDIRRGETLGLVGESGCGKSTAARSLLRLEPPTDGEIRFDGEIVGNQTDDERKRFRRRTGIIFQDPTSSFDPRLSIGESVAEPLALHGLRDHDRRRSLVETMLAEVGLSADDYDRYPHELSGGQKQRVALARALVSNPELLVADEPVSALDVSVEAEILALIERLQTTFGLSILLISHDMSVVRDVCDRVAVMYLGEIVERGPTEAVFADPQHPYTRALLASMTTPDPTRRGERAELSGTVPDPADPPPGCRFHTRCPAVIQPPDYDFDQQVWRGILDLRIALRNRTLDTERLRTRLVTEGDAEHADEISGAELRTAIRAAHDIPDELHDANAEQVLSAALAEIVAGELATAEERLNESFATICCREQPALEETEAGHRAACHLHDVGGESSTAESVLSGQQNG